MGTRAIRAIQGKTGVHNQENQKIDDNITIESREWDTGNQRLVETNKIKNFVELII